MLRGDFLDTSNRNLVAWFHDVFVMKSSWVLNWASFGTDMFPSSSKEIYHRLLQQARKFQWICTYIILKKHTLIKNIKTPSGLGAKLHEQSVFLRASSMHTHRLCIIIYDIYIIYVIFYISHRKSHQTSSSKIICVFSIPGTMFWKYIFTETNSKLNSTPLLNVSLHAHLPWCTSRWLPSCDNQFFIIVKTKVLSKAGFAEIASLIILNLNFLSRKTLKTPYRLQRDFTNLTSQGHQYKSFQGHQRTLFQFIQRMNSNMQSVNHLNLRMVSEYEQLWFAIDLYL